MLGMEGVEAGLSRTRRVPIPGEFTKTGRPATTVERFDEGNVPLRYHSRFPSGIREFRGVAAAYYTGEQPPAGIALEDPRRRPGL
jgi:hypothetical protein